MEDLALYSLEKCPIASFVNWHKDALKIEANADAMSVATFDQSKMRPNSRYILYKGMIDQNIIFFTNYLSAKSKDLENNSEVALNFYWHESKKQVRINGRVKKMNYEDSDKYFQSRDRDSQLASYVSSQSSEIEDKKALLNKFEEAKKMFEGKVVPMPKHWGGYLIDAYEFEFFLYGANRLNDRFLYEKINGIWDIKRLQP